MAFYLELRSYFVRDLKIVFYCNFFLSNIVFTTKTKALLTTKSRLTRIQQSQSLKPFEMNFAYQPHESLNASERGLHPGRADTYNTVSNCSF